MRTLVLFVLTSGLYAQVAEFGVHGGASTLQGKNIGQLSGADLTLKDGFRLGGRITLNNWRFFGHEFGYAYNRTKLTLPGQELGTAIHQGFYNMLAYAMPEGSKVRPFLAGGGHFSNFVPPGSSASQGGGDNKFGFNYGGGIKAKVSPRFLIRFDVRQYVTGKPFDLPGAKGKIRQTEISAGFSLYM